MSAVEKPGIARRPLLVGLLVTGALALAGLAAIESPRLFARHYPPTPYDDLLSLLPDRDSAAQLGRAYISAQKSFDTGNTAIALRRRIAGKSLVDAADADFAEARMVEAHGWVLPETLVLLCALAAKLS